MTVQVDIDQQVIIDRIRKLLALSKSPVEGEASAALNKARELMAKYRLEEHFSEVTGKESLFKQFDILFFSTSGRDTHIKLQSVALNESDAVGMCRIYMRQRFQKNTDKFGYRVERKLPSSFYFPSVTLCVDSLPDYLLMASYLVDMCPWCMGDRSADDSDHSRCRRQGWPGEGKAL